MGLEESKVYSIPVSERMKGCTEIYRNPKSKTKLFETPNANLKNM
jgi:hypothetical protein